MRQPIASAGPWPERRGARPDATRRGNRYFPLARGTRDRGPPTRAGRPAYDATAEVSVYIATAYQRRGIGRCLKQWVIGQCPRLGVTTLLSMHFDHNEATRRINESLGFRQMGHLPEIAVVQGHKRGLVIWALRIPPGNDEPVAAADRPRD